MLEQLINSLDQRGLLVIQAMLGKRAIDILETENIKPEEKPKPKPKLLLPQG